MKPVEELVQLSDVELEISHVAQRVLQSVVRERVSRHLQHLTVEQRI